MDKQLEDYIQRSINSICPHESGHKQTLYHTGFLMAILIKLIKNDSKNLDIFKSQIAKNKKND